MKLIIHQEEYSISLDEIKLKDDQIQKLQTELNWKDDVILELTEKVIDIKKQVQVLTSKKNQQIQDMEIEISENDQHLEELQDVYLMKEEKVTIHNIYISN